jgi:hypothetical protein
MIFPQVAPIKPAYKKRGTGTLFYHNVLHPRLEAIKLLASLTYPPTITKCQPTPHPNTSRDLLPINIRHHVTLSGGCGCGWRLKLLLESGNHHCPLLELEVMHLNDVLEVHNHVGTGVHLLKGKV